MTGASDRVHERQGGRAADTRADLPRVLFASDRHPWECSTGEHKRQYNLLVGLAEVARVTCVTVAREPPPPIPSRVAEQLDALHVTAGVPDDSAKPRGTLKGRLATLTHALVARRPRSFEPRFDQMLAEESRAALSGDYDLVFVCRLACAYQWNLLGRRPAILDLDDIEHEKLGQRLEFMRDQRTNPLLRVVLRGQLRQWRNAELASLNQFDRVLVCSRRDADYLDSAAVSVVPNGATFPSIAPDAPGESDDRVLFFGAMAYTPNSEGLLWFLDHVWPLVRRTRPQASLRVAGPGIGDSVQARDGRDGVQVVGFVEDLAAELKRAAVVIVPLLWGGGTRLKIVESAAHAKAIVSTRIGAEGLEFEDDREICLADAPDDFATRVLRLCGDPSLRSRMGAAAFEKGRRLYDWAQIRGSVAALVTETLAGHRAAGSRRS